MKTNRNKKEIGKEILKWIAVTGAVCVAASSPYFVFSLTKSYRRWKRYKDRQITDVFYRLRRQGLIDIKKSNHQIYISLTKEGKKKAGKYQIDDLKIVKSKVWDKKWRIIIFDIPNKVRIKRDAFRGKLKEFGFYLLQKSVWVYPYECQKQIELLREFFGLSKKQIRVITTDSIEEDKFLRKIFNF